MRAALAIGLLITLGASVNAAPLHRFQPREGHSRPVQRVTGPTSRFAVPGWTDEETRQWLYNGSAASLLG
ncbi:hypothetical protein FFI89_031680 [Bradyrhizobium sp. KBS0727]|nr:hypothetical protein FFI71_031685 [Bradyrhizobium sp. KBS0725]QDW47889.1 hypothetical protein FFI89_031680 [Bradyrhizobium sp. KBS0727]